MDYWGRPDASVSFCENKYAKYYWIAEYHNTISALSYIFIGICFLKSRLRFLGQLLCAVGVGAVVLHMTLRYYGQMFDEMAMLALSFYSAREVQPQVNKHIIWPLLLGYIWLHDTFMYFFIVFTIMQCMIAYSAEKKLTQSNRIWLILYAVTFIVGTLCWLGDQLCVHQPHTIKRLAPLQLHACWHLCTAAAIGFGFLGILFK